MVREMPMPNVEEQKTNVFKPLIHIVPFHINNAAIVERVTLIEMKQINKIKLN